MNSCIYRGDIFHKRFSPKLHAFNYQMDYVFLDLDELDAVFSLSRFWSLNRPNLVSFQRQDYLPSSEPSLKAEVGRQIERLGGQPTSGKVYLLATLRCLGYCMNPIALYYCYEGDELKYVLAEVHNTPWDERHAYLLEGPDFGEPTRKSLHVSPFMPMNMAYRWKLSDPDCNLDVVIYAERESEQLFTASMKLERLTLNKRNATACVWRQARQAFKTIAAIYWQAARLWLKKVPFYGHPVKERLRETNK